MYQAVNLVGLKLLVLFLCGSWNPSSVILSLAIACPIQDSQKFGQRLYSDFEAPLPGTRLTRTLPSSFGRDCACPKFCPLVLEARKICWCSTKVLVPFYLVTKVWPSLRLRAVEMLSSFHSKCQVPSQVSLLFVHSLVPSVVVSRYCPVYDRCQRVSWSPVGSSSAVLEAKLLDQTSRSVFSRVLFMQARDRAR